MPAPAGEYFLAQKPIISIGFIENLLTGEIP
jgi:hypothetical protein